MADPVDVAVIGLGSMGLGIARSVLRAGHRVLGVDIDRARVDGFIAEGGREGDLRDVAGDLDAAVIVVVNATQTEHVLFGPDGLAAKLRPGAVVLACATVEPAFAGVMAERCAETGILYLDSPISGGSIKAEAGTLSVMAAGSADAFSAADPVLEAMSETVFRLGDKAGAGSAMKAVNQLLAGVHCAAMAEALTFGMTQGVEPKAFLDVISKCAGTSWILENRAPHIVAGDYAPRSAVDIWLKDLGIVLDAAKAAKFSAPLTATALQQFLAASGSGLGGEDDSAVAKVYARNAGLSLPGEA